MNTPAVTIRPAFPTDVRPAIALIRLSMGEEVDWLFGQEKKHPADSVLTILFQNRSNRLSHDVCWMAEHEGQVAGLLVAYPGHRLRGFELRTGLHLIGIIGIGGTIRVVRQQPVYGDLIEAEADEFYVSNLAVSPALQGRGIGAALLAQADDLAASAGLSKCSLIVTFDNPARRLYERCGYKVVHSYNITHPIVAHGSGGYHRMVKQLTLQ
jgi:ribosomal protein S18 acetylase RimI-like enzyme